MQNYADLAVVMGKEKARKRVIRGIEKGIKYYDEPIEFLEALAGYEGIPVNLMEDVAEKGLIRSYEREISEVIEERAVVCAEEIYNYIKEDGWIEGYSLRMWTVTGKINFPKYVLIYSDNSTLFELQKESTFEEIEKKLLSIDLDEQDLYYLIEDGKIKDFALRYDSKMKPYIMWQE